MTILTTACTVCGGYFEFEDDYFNSHNVPNGYCSYCCYEIDMEAGKDDRYCPKCAFPVGEDLNSVPYYIPGQKCPNCGFLEEKP